MRRERALKVVLVLVGLLFTAGVYPLIGGLLHPADSDTGDTMMMSLYFAVGVFLTPDGLYYAYAYNRILSELYAADGLR
jgi:hypothetical protein